MQRASFSARRCGDRHGRCQAQWPAHRQTDRAIPGNVNFAVNAEYARALLDRSGVPCQTATAGEAMSTPAIAARVLKFTVSV